MAAYGTRRAKAEDATNNALLTINATRNLLTIFAALADRAPDAAPSGR